LLDQLAVDARRLVERVLDDANVGDLTAEVEVEQFEAVLHAATTQFFEAAQDFGDGEPDP
jgi:hypothetical protein